MNCKHVVILAIVLAFAWTEPAWPDQPAAPLTIQRIFGDKEFETESFGPFKWLEEGRFYTTVEHEPRTETKPAADAANDQGTDGDEVDQADHPDNQHRDAEEEDHDAPQKIVKFNTQTGESSVLVTADQLTPQGAVTTT